MPFIIVALLLAATIGAGASVVAENALPGDPLWSFRTNINEKVEEALAPEGKARADFHIAAIESRKKDAARLSSSATLTPEVKTEIETNIASHVHGAEAQVATLGARGDYGAAADKAARLQSALAKQHSALLDLSALLDEASALSAETSGKTKQ